jgi:MFS transporter, SP family, major inositol transporter
MPDLPSAARALPVPVTPDGAIRRQTWVAIAATVGGFLFGYDTGVIAGALLYITADLDLSAAESSIVVSCLLLGAALGASVGGRISDTLGRRRVIHLAAVLFALGTLGSALAGGLAVMITSRVILGIAVGAVSAVVPLYIGEIAPVERRGRLVNQNELMIVIGQFSATAVNAILANTVGGLTVWRWMLGAALIPAVVLFVGTFFIPESPRFLAKNERFDDAEASLRRIRTAEEARAETTRMRELYEAHRDEAKADPRKYLTIRWVRILVLIGIGVSIVQQVSGVNAVVYYAPTILEATGLAANASVTGSIAIAAMGVIAVSIGMYLVGRVNRRPMLITGLIATATCLGTIGLMFLLLPSSTGQTVAILVTMVVFIFFQQCFISTVTWLVLAELFPMKVRGFAMGIAVLFQWLANFTVSTLFPNVAVNYGPSVAFFGFVVLILLGLLFTIKVMPETRGHSLEELERMSKARYSR